MAESSVRFGRAGLIRLLLLFSPSIFILVIVVYPFVSLVHGNLNGNFLSQLTGNSTVSILTRRALYNSLLQGGISAAASLAAGIPLGLFLGRFNFRLKKLVSSLVIVPFFLPSIIVVFAFISGFGYGSPAAGLFPSSAFFSTGLAGIVAANTFFNAPLVALFTMTAVEQADRSLIEASKTLGTSAFYRFRTIWGRNGMLAAAGGALLAFTYSFAGFAAPLIIGGPGYFTLDAWIYFMVKILNNLPAAIGLAILEAAVLLIPAMIFISFSSLRRRVTGIPSESSNVSFERGPYFYAGTAYTIAWIAIELYLLSSVFVASLSGQGGQMLQLSNYTGLFGSRATSAIGISAGSAILNSVFYGITTSLIVVTIGVMWITAKRRMNSGGKFISEPFQYVPLVVSSIIMAFAITIIFGSMTPASLLWALIVLAQSAVAIPVVLRVVDAGFSSIPRTYSEASLTLSGNPLLDVELPLARSAFASALMFGFVMSLGEFTATNFIATTGYIPLTVEIYMLRNARLFGPSFAAAAILLMVSLVAFYLIQKMGEKLVDVR